MAQAPGLPHKPKMFEKYLPVLAARSQWYVAAMALLWSLGAPIGYIGHHWLFADTGDDLLTYVRTFINDHWFSLIYVAGGTSLFFSLFGMAVGGLLKNIHAANQRLEYLNSIKDQYVAVCSHDLKSPLTGIIGYANLIASAEDAPKAYRELAEYIEACGAHLLAIVNDVLDLSRMQMLGSSAAKEPVNLAAIARDVVKIYCNLAARKGLTLTLNVDPQAVTVISGVKIQLDRALGNLVSNAIKFTNRGGAIEVSLAKEGEGFVTLAVADSGIGMPRAAAAKILESTVGLRRAGTSGEESTGIGLEVVKQVASTHAAKLSLASTEGVGSRFSMTFPVLI